MVLGQVFVGVLRFSLVSVIAPVIHLFVYHRRCLISAADAVYVQSKTVQYCWVGNL